MQLYDTFTIDLWTNIRFIHEMREKKTTITTNESRKNNNNNKYLTNTFWSTSNWIQFQPVHNFKVKKNNNKYNYANDQN